MEAEATKLGLRVEIAELGGLWEIVEIYPYRLTDELATGKAECAGGEHMINSSSGSLIALS